MFEQMILSEPRGHKRWTVVAAFAGQLLAIGALIAIPLLTVQQLPLADLSTVLIAPAPPPPPPPPPPPAAARAPQTARVTPQRFDASRVFTPQAVPKTVAALPDLPQAPLAVAPSIAGVEGRVQGGVDGGQIGGVLGGVLGGVPSVAPPPPPPQKADTPPPAAAPKLLRVGGQVEAARVISAPPPSYPVLAKEVRIGGVVTLDAVIGMDGHIENLKLISGPPLLVDAAMNAVKQWTYRPTILNGQPFKVETQILVNFSLG